jgi:hypothetical protein
MFHTIPNVYIFRINAYRSYEDAAGGSTSNRGLKVRKLKNVEYFNLLCISCLDFSAVVQ